MLGGDLKRQARFAGASRPGQGEQTGGGKKAFDLRHLALAPDKAGDLRGQIVRKDLKRPQGRKLVRQIIDHELEDALGLAKVLQPPLAEIAKGDFGREGFAHAVRRDMGEQGLPAVADGEDAGHPIERGAEVVVVALFRLALVDRHANAQGAGFLPGGRGQGPLGFDGCGDGIAGIRIGHAKGVADGLKDVSAMLLKNSAQKGVVLRQRPAHGLGMRFP